VLMEHLPKGIEILKPDEFGPASRSPRAIRALGAVALWGSDLRVFAVCIG
jgi:hypothetical protein